jgi:hypothetical protein
MLIVQTTKLKRRVRIWACATGRVAMSLASLLAVTIALFAVLRFWAVPVAYRRSDPPRSAIWPSPMGGHKRDSGLSNDGQFSNCRVGSAATFLAQRAWAHSKAAKCLIRPISF